MTEEKLIVTCRTCLGEFDVITAGWCSCEKRGPSKVCPFCYRCFCDLPEAEQAEMWRMMPPAIVQEHRRLAQERKDVKKSPQQQIFDMFELPRNTYTVLVVEDDLGLQKYLTKLIKSYFLNPLVASTGDEALAIVRSHRIHLVLLDLMIPGLNGFQVCKILKEDPETKNLPVIITTARDGVVDKVKGFVLGVDDYLTKPFHGTELAIRVLNLLRKYYLH